MDTIQWSPGVTLEDLERQAILIAFRHYRGNKTSTATALGISIRTLDAKLEKYEDDDKKFKESEDEHRRKEHDWELRQRGIRTGADGAIYTINSNPANDTLTAHAHSGNSNVQQTTKAAGQIQNEIQTQPGLNVEPAVKPSAQQQVSVPVAEKVQGVLPVNSSRSGNNRNR